MPVPWRHYVPLDLSNLTGSVEELMARQNEWADIAAAGRAWALQFYSPQAVAERFLGVCAAELAATAAPSGRA
jgi:hypothetical protein